MAAPTASSAPASTAVRRIRVMRIIDRLIVGGPTKNAVYLSAGLEPEHFETLLVTGVPAKGEVAATDFVRSSGLQPLEIPKLSRELSPSDLFVAVRLLREMFRFRPDIVHTHKSKAGATGRVAAFLYRWLTPGAVLLRPRRCRVLHTFHGHIFHSYYGPLKTMMFVSIERLLGHFLTDRIIVISEQQRQEICHDFRIARADQFTVIPLGFDFSEMASHGDFRREFAIGRDEFVVASIGRLTEVKNFELFLDACALAIRNDPGIPFRFVIVGEGHLRPALEARAAALGISDRVLFTGVRTDIGNIYAQCDLVALSSRNEGTPLTVLEGLSFGKPVLTTEVGGVVDILGRRGQQLDGFQLWEHGASVGSGDAAGFAAALCWMAHATAEVRADMGRCGRSAVLSRYSKQRLIADTERLYRELAGRT